LQNFSIIFGFSVAGSQHCTLCIMGNSLGELTNRRGNSFALTAEERDPRILALVGGSVEFQVTHIDSAGRVVLLCTAHSANMSYSVNTTHRWELRIPMAEILMRQEPPPEDV
jgi:hypothetical protein